MTNPHRRLHGLAVLFSLLSIVVISTFVRVAQMHAGASVEGTGVAQSNLGPQTQKSVQTSTAGGLKVTIFNTANGRVIVNLPDDMMAGDTISGTVVAEPKGNS